MTTLDELVRRRRSIRRYRSERPPEEWLEAMIATAIQAPSSGNRQPVRFFEIASAPLRKALQEELTAGKDLFLKRVADAKLRNLINFYFRFSEFMFEAPILLAAGTVTKIPSFSATLTERGITIPEERWERDADMALGLALSGFILKGEELGLGTCILTAPLAFMGPPEKTLSLSEVKIKCFLTVGYPDEHPKPPPRKTVEEIFRKI